MYKLFEVIPHYKPTIGVMGAASGHLIRNKELIKVAREIGRQISKHGCILGNGACPGLPNEAAKGAKEDGGETYGVSPAISIYSHIKKYRSPTKNYDNILFTGMGLMMRDIINIRSSDAVIILPGGTGTLNEFTVAYDEGKPIGILTGFGGVADHIKEILDFCHRPITGRMVISDNPLKLVHKLYEIMKNIEFNGSLDDYLLGDDGEVTKIEKNLKGISNNQIPLFELEDEINRP